MTPGAQRKRELQQLRRAEYLERVGREEGPPPAPRKVDHLNLGRIWPFILRCGDRSVEECDHNLVAADDAGGAE